MPKETISTSTEIDLFDTEVEVDFVYKSGEVTIDAMTINGIDVSAMFDSLYVVRADVGGTMSVRAHLVDTIKSMVDEGTFDEE